MRDDNATLKLPAREIPLPRSISETARAALLQGANRSGLSLPALDDMDAWRDHIHAFDDTLRPAVDLFRQNANLIIEQEHCDGLTLYQVRPESSALHDKRANLLLHGGAFVYVGGELVIIPAAVAAMHYGGVVIAPDYRMPPDHPFPAALDDCLAAYQYALKHFEPENILVSGESAGGNLAVAMLHRARDSGLPKPGALFLNTPAVDLSRAGDSIYVNQGVDLVLTNGVGGGPDLYLAENDPYDPCLSPIYGDFSTGFPPTYVRTGTRDLLLSDSVRVHAALRKAGVEADLYVGEAMPHGGFAILGTETEEDFDARADLIRWLSKHWPA